ncbi:hypothetical protein N7G274_009458 [Stereocaulon virgatum]|uniref:RWD domain-containing protein n=1 Tax=Stereocaulon virgatum TaxID=373712 RepID=A0ABR4A340_9LECA
MSEDLENEIEAINSIYGADALRKADGSEVYILLLSQHNVSLRVSFPHDYPESMPQILGTQSTGENSKKGSGKYILDLAREILGSVFVSGSVCLFDLLQDLDLSLSEESNDQSPLQLSGVDQDTGPIAIATAASLHEDLDEEPQWILSGPVIEKKSTFIARACAVRSPAQARACIAHLLNTDKRVSKATHNVSAYRIHSAGETTTSEVVYQDCDDDGERAARGRLLHLLQVMDVWDLLVVVSRWYGGVKLGPDRFSIINNVAREAIVEGGWTRSRLIRD